MSIGIYKIVNIITKEIYIGKAVRIQYRINEHFRELNLGVHYNKHLQRSFNKYGRDNFKFEIIEECPKEEISSREMYYIEFYNSFYTGYNQTLGGEGMLGNKWNGSQTETMRAFMKGNNYGKGNKSFSGRSHTEESKNKTRLALIGRKRGKYKTKIK